MKRNVGKGLLGYFKQEGSVDLIDILQDKEPNLNTYCTQTASRHCGLCIMINDLTFVYDRSMELGPSRSFAACGSIIVRERGRNEALGLYVRPF